MAGEHFAQHVGRKRMLENEDRQRAAIPEHKRLRNKARTLREHVNAGADEFGWVVTDPEAEKFYAQEIAQIKELEARADELERLEAEKREREWVAANPEKAEEFKQKEEARQREKEWLKKEAVAKYPINEGDSPAQVTLMQGLREQFLRNSELLDADQVEEFLRSKENTVEQEDSSSAPEERREATG